MAILKDLIVNGDSRIIGNNYNNSPKIAYGTCSTAAGTAVKVVTVADPAWDLQVGNIIGVKFTNANTASTVKLNVNNSGDIQLSYNTSRPYTGSDALVTGAANKTTFYQYDGSYWHWISSGYNTDNNTYTSALSTTAAGTAAKTASMTYYTATANSYVHINFQYANTAASALTLNINSQGNKSIYINGTASSSTNYTLPAGSYIAYYDGTNYYFRTDGKLTTDITGSSEKIKTNLSSSNQTYYLTGVTDTTSTNDSQLYSTRMSGTYTGVKYQTSTSAAGGTLTVDERPVTLGLYYDIS